MPYEDLLVLIPSHSLEDFPTEQTEDEAASLLNAFAVVWHPALLATAKVLPAWNRADSPPESSRRKLVIVPRTCESWLPSGWAERTASEGSVVVRNVSERDKMLEEALHPFSDLKVDPELAADFLALGTCYLQMELLTRKMRNYSSIDETHLQREAVAAAEAAVAGDDAQAKSRLRACFELLHAARERFYPVDCYLLDICLLIPRQADEKLVAMLHALRPVSVLAMVKDLEAIAAEKPEVHAALREAWHRGTADLVAGEWSEAPSAVWPLGSVLWQFDRGREGLDKLFGKRPVSWGRRRYGLFTQLPQILKKSGYLGAMHVVLDDGIYPDTEQTKFRWEGNDGSVMDAVSRIPLAADSSTSYLRFPDRMSESMDHDHVAGVFFARWPEVKSPFFEDLRRMSAYAPVLGRWVTLADFFTNTDSTTRLSIYKSREYLAPYLVHAVAREERNPVSRFSDHFELRHRLETAVWLHGVTALLTNRQPPVLPVEHDLETRDEVATPESLSALRTQIEESTTAGQRALADIIVRGGGPRPGYLVINPAAFRRTVSIDLPEGSAPPELTGENMFVQWTDRKAMTVDVPGAGFVWVPTASHAPASKPAAKNPPMAEEHLLRNEFFEVHLSPETGGIRQIKNYDRSPNRLSQQLNYRYSHERSFTVGQGDDAEEVKTHYAEMRRSSTRITCAGPALGEIVTTGSIVDQKTNQTLATYEQTVRVWRGRKVVEIESVLTPTKLPDAEPWHNYYTSRWAWNDETASLTRSVMLGAHEVVDQERIESPHYLEIATTDQRTTILPHGLPFHRKTGYRMLDTILITQREEQRRFKFTIAIDEQFPMQAALDAMVPPVVIPTMSGPPRSGSAGWFFHLNTRGVQILSILPLLPEPVESDDMSVPGGSAAPAGNGCTVRMIETEGRPMRVKLRCVRTPVSARQRSFVGRTVVDLTIQDDAVIVDFTGHEIVDVEMRF